MQQQDYKPHDIEREAQQYWEEHKSFSVKSDLSKEKYYCLAMFPYPSGNLHMGHVRNYTIPDVIARYQRMKGKNVLHPIGWDAFGLPAENAALKHKVAPSEWTYKNIAQMREEFKRLGLGYDWSREFATCEPDYYRWEQWFFLKLFEKGLVYKKNSEVNWDPVDQTVLSNEQVIDGKGWRSGAPVERREIPQWFLKITAYADELLKDLDTLEDWPNNVRTMQRNWIGQSQGVEITFDIPELKTAIDIFTTRADTLWGVTYIAIAPQHPIAKQAAKNNDLLKDFLENCKHIKMAEADIATLEKKGVDTGLKAIHPLTGEVLPIWVTNFVLMSYGTGAVMSVPAHDQRDYEFAKKYHLPLKQVIRPTEGIKINLDQAAFSEKGFLIHSGSYDGLSSDEGSDAITKALEINQQGRQRVTYRLRDWGISRQRYWGAPIPIIDCPSCGPVPVPEENLPVVLPENIILDTPSSPLKEMPEFYETTCPKCHSNAKRETDTFDTFMESSWYYARFACKKCDKAMLDGHANYWLPVDQYVGGIEHAILHLLYARFIHKLLRDEGLVNSNEPFTRLLTQGMVLKDGIKMSKSKGNTVVPMPLIEKYGADSTRLFIIFAAPPEQNLDWSDSGMEGAFRFLKKLWAFAYQHRDIIERENHAIYLESQITIDWSQTSDTLRTCRRQFYEILKLAKYDYKRQQLNTVVSGCMKMLNLLNELNKNDEEPARDYFIQESMSILLRLLAPIAPHITHHLWRSLKFGEEILDAPWPKSSSALSQLHDIELVVQVNGKLRSKIHISIHASDSEIEKIALNNAKIQEHTRDKTIKKIIIVPNKLINIVIGE